MAKIFLSFYNAIKDPANDQAMPGFYESFIKGLVEAGNEVMISTFSPQNVCWDFPVPPKPVEEKVRKFSPDLAILFNNCGYQWEHLLDCPILVYEVDSPLLYHNKKNLEQSPGRFHFVVPQPSSLNVLRELYPSLPNTQATYLPFFTSVQPEDLPQTDNISIICSLFGQSSQLNLFMKEEPTEEELNQYRNIRELIEANPFISSHDLFSQISDLSDKVRRFIDIPEIILSISSDRRVQLLSILADLGLALYGTRNWTDLLHAPELVMSYRKTPVHSLRQNQDIYNHSKIGININHIQAKTGFSWRVMDIMASNACLVTESQDIYHTLFPDVAIPQYTTRFEAREICQKLLREENQRRDIVHACQETIREKYRFPHLLKGLESFLNLSLQQEGMPYEPIWLPQPTPEAIPVHKPATQQEPLPGRWKESFHIKASLSKKTRLRFSVLKKKN